MATFWEPPPIASVAAVIGMVALSYAIGLTGGRRRETDSTNDVGVDPPDAIRDTAESHGQDRGDDSPSTVDGGSATTARQPVESAGTETYGSKRTDLAPTLPDDATVRS